LTPTSFCGSLLGEVSLSLTPTSFCGSLLGEVSLSLTPTFSGGPPQMVFSPSWPPIFSSVSHPCGVYHTETSDRPTTWTRWFRRPRRRYNIRPAFRARAPISHREDIRRFPQHIPAFRAAIIHIPYRIVPGRRPASGAYRAFRFRDTVNLPVPPGFIGEVSGLFGIRFRCTPRDIRIILPGGRIEPVRHPQPPSSYTAGRPQNTSAETGTLHSPAGCLHSPVCRNIVV